MDNVNDILSKINELRELSEEAKRNDEKFKKVTTKNITWDDDGKRIETLVDRKDFITFAKEAIGQTKLEINFKKLNESAVIPSYAHDGDVGMDLTAIDVEYNFDMDCYIYHTGLSFESPFHYGMFLFPRSSNRKTEAYLCNHVGIADSAIYRGEIMLCYKNRTSLRQIALEARSIAFFNAIDDGKSIQEANAEGIKAWNYAFKHPMLFAPYKVGERVGQMVVLPYPNVKLVEKETLTETERGAGGFGSTDKKQ